MSSCKITALCNQKGGVTKTTTTANLGIGLAMQGKKVLLADIELLSRSRDKSSNAEENIIPTYGRWWS